MNTPKHDTVADELDIIMRRIIEGQAEDLRKVTAQRDELLGRLRNLAHAIRTGEYIEECARDAASAIAKAEGRAEGINQGVAKRLESEIGEKA